MDSSFVFFIFGILIFILVIGLLIVEHKNIKVFALITPAMISIIMFGAIFIKDYDTVSLNEIDIGLSILGIAVSVWVGLNIYNVLEKKEVDELKNKLSKNIEDLSVTYENKIIKVENDSKNILKQLYLSNYEVTLEHFNPADSFSVNISECLKIVIKYDSYLKYEDIIPYDKTLELFDFIGNCIREIEPYLNGLQNENGMYIRADLGENLYYINRILSYINEYLPMLSDAHGVMYRQLVMVSQINENLRENLIVIERFSNSTRIIELRGLIAISDHIISRLNNDYD